MKNPLLYLNNQTPKGRTIVAPKWEQTRLDSSSMKKLPFYARIERNWQRAFSFACFTLMIYGLFAYKPAITACTATFLLILHYMNHRAIRQLDSIVFKGIAVANEVYEMAELTIRIHLSNSGKSTIYNAILEVTFLGSSSNHQHQLIPSLAPGRQFSLNFNFIADCGMGDFQLGSIQIALTDQLGIGSYAINFPTQEMIRVLPEDIKLSKIQVKRAGSAQHSGVYEIMSAGRGPSFLGLREWRSGDPVHHIDWKRSMRSNAILVKEFETIAAVDATLICEDCAIGHSQYKSISSRESLRDSLIAICRSLSNQQIRQQWICNTTYIPLGNGDSQVQMMIQTIIDLSFSSNERITSLLARTLFMIPSGSLCVLSFCSYGIDISELLTLLTELENKRVDFALLVIDSQAFASQIGIKANIDPHQQQFLQTLLIRDQSGSKEMRRLISKVFARTYFIGAKETIADVYNHNLGV